MLGRDRDGRRRRVYPRSHRLSLCFAAEYSVSKQVEGRVHPSDQLVGREEGGS